MKLGEILKESVEDRGTFKAVFLAGPPGAGKTTLMRQIYNTDIGPRVVDPDRIADVMSQNLNIDHNQLYVHDTLKHEVKRKQVKQIVQYVNGMLPMFIDATGADIPRTQERALMLHSFGYDTMMIWLGTDLQKVMDNMRFRNRKTPEEFVNTAVESLLANYRAYENFFGPDFHVHENYFMTPEEKDELRRLKDQNDEEELTGVEAGIYDHLMDRLKQQLETVTSLEYVEKTTNKFLSAPIRNVQGRKNLSYLQTRGQKYLSPGIYSLEKITEILSGW